MKVWPFKPWRELDEELEWRTDVIQAKAAEQRIAMRVIPRRVFNVRHVMNSASYAYARALIREAQADEITHNGFWFPDWTQSVEVGALTAGASVPVEVVDALDIGGKAIIWESEERYEIVDVTPSTSGFTITTLELNYKDAVFLPALRARAPEGISADRSAGGPEIPVITLQAAFVCFPDNDIAVQPAAVYRGLDVLDECPVIGGGTFNESLVWGASEFDNGQNLPHFIRKRTIPEMRYSMRWHVFTHADEKALREWLYWRRGKQRAFWMSSRGADITPAGDPVGTVLPAYSYPGLLVMGRDGPFDIEVTTAAGVEYRRVLTITTTSATYTGTAVDGPQLVELTLDTELAVTGITRISFLRCTRFDADRVEVAHSAAGGAVFSVSCIEVEEPA